MLNVRSLGMEGMTIILVDYLLQIHISVCVLVVRARMCVCSLASAVSSSLRSCGYRPPGSSVHGILQARILEWVAMPSSQGIFPTQGTNPHLLLWHLDSLPLSHWRPPYVSPDLLIHPCPLLFFFFYFTILYWSCHIST